MGSSSVRFGLDSAGDGVEEVLVVVVLGAESVEGSMTIRRRVGWRACRDMLVVACSVWSRRGWSTVRMG